MPKNKSENFKMYEVKIILDEKDKKLLWKIYHKKFKINITRIHLRY